MFMFITTILILLINCLIVKSISDDIYRSSKENICFLFVCFLGFHSV